MRTACRQFFHVTVFCPLPAATNPTISIRDPRLLRAQNRGAATALAPAILPQPGNGACPHKIGVVQPSQLPRQRTNFQESLRRASKTTGPLNMPLDPREAAPLLELPS